MLHPFIATRPAGHGRPGALVLSVVAHVALIVTLVSLRVTTASSGGTLLRREYPTERIHFIEVSRAPVLSSVAKAPTRQVRARPATSGAVPDRLPVLAPLKPLNLNLAAVASVPSVLPGDVDLTSKVTDSLDFKPIKTDDAVGNGSGRGGGKGAPADGIYTADMVERTVMPFPNNPKPLYPSSLLSSGVEGQFVVHFVVDAKGRVDDRSVEFPSSAHRLFVDAVRRALKGSRYRPAEVDGQPVRQLVEQQFTFRIER